MNSDLGGSRIVIEDLEKHFATPGTGELHVLVDISLTVPAGSVVSIVGPSGCGKSTLLKMIAGLILPSRGVIRVDGVVVSQPAPDRIPVFQDLHLFHWMTVFKNVEFAFRMKYQEYGPDEIKNIIAMVGLTGFEAYYPHEISGGMRQRLALARALGANPSILLLDEPFSALDVGTKMNLESDFLALVKKRQITTMLVTHDVRQALFLSDKIVVLSKRPGKISEVIEVDYECPRAEDLWEEESFRKLEVSISKMLK